MRLSRRPVSVLLREDSPSRLPREDSPSRVPLVPSGPLAELTAAGLVAVGAALVVWAYRIAPTAGIQSYDPIFWAGMLLAYLAVAWRAVSGRHAVFWLGLLGLFTVLPTFWMSPGGPIGFDEIAQFALLRNVISAGRLFQHTPLLPIGTFYPGLESAAATIHWLTGLSPWDSALTLIAVVHCLLPVQVYYIARALPVPHRWAAVAGLVYAANPSFVYFDAQFAYESVAILLMLTIVRLYVEALAAERSGSPHLETEPINVTADSGDLLRPCGDTPSHQPDRHRPALGGRALSQADKRARRPQGWLAPPVRQVDAGVDAGDVLRVVGCLRRANNGGLPLPPRVRHRISSLSPWPLAPRLVVVQRGRSLAIQLLLAMNEPLQSPRLS